MKKAFLFALVASILCFQSCTEDFGTIEVTYTKATAIYGDLDELRNVDLKEPAKEIVNPGKIFVSQSLLLIGEEGEGIHVIDNTNPASPVSKYFINIPQNREYYVENQIIFAESHYDMVKIDLTDIENPVLVSRVENAFSEELLNDKGEVLIGFNFEEVTEEVEDGSAFLNQIHNQNFIYYDYANSLIPESAVPASFAGNSSNGIGSVNRVAYYQDHVYVIGNQMMTVFSDNGDLEKVNAIYGSGQMETVYPFQGNLFVGTRNSMNIYDITDAADPRFTSSFWHATSCDPVYPTEEVAYVTLRTGDFSACPGDINALVVLDITTIERPEEIGEIEMSSPYGMTLFNDRLYVGEGANGLKIFDATNRRQLELITWDKSIQAYDVIQHPSRADMLLIAGPEGLGQYEIESGEGLGLLSWMNF